jgi:hypothetical protein
MNDHHHTGTTTANANNASGERRKPLSRKEIQLRTVLSEEDMKLLTNAQAVLRDIEAIAEQPEDKRRLALTYVAEGMKPRAALVKAQNPESFVDETPPFVKPEAEMSDEEWFGYYCSDAAERIRRDEYKVAAIQWRQTKDARVQLYQKTKKALKKDPHNPFANLISRLNRITHPKDWPFCARCNCTGRNSSGDKCPTCHGHGFDVRLEDRR